MLNSLLKRLGYIQRNDITDDELIDIIVSKWTDNFNDDIEKEQEDKVFKSIVGIEGFNEYLRVTLIRDMKRYFKAMPIQQPEIRGAFMRTSYMRSKLMEQNKVSSTRLENVRYTE